MCYTRCLRLVIDCGLLNCRLRAACTSFRPPAVLYNNTLTCYVNNALATSARKPQEGPSTKHGSNTTNTLLQDLAKQQEHDEKMLRSKDQRGPKIPNASCGPKGYNLSRSSESNMCCQHHWLPKIPCRSENQQKRSWVVCSKQKSSLDRNLTDLDTPLHLDVERKRERSSQSRHEVN